MKSKSNKKTSTRGGKLISAVYNSVTQFWGAINGKAMQEGWHNSSNSHNFDFCGTKTFDEATELLLQGDRATADKVLRDVAAIKRLINKQAKRMRVETGVVGFAPNVPNYLAGVPRSMITAKPAERKDKVINVVYNFGAAWTISTDDMIKAVINLAGAVYALEAGGARVNVYGGCCTWYKSDEVGVFIKVKNASQPMDTLKMIYPLGHPSMLRRHGFRWYEVTKGIPSGFKKTFGHCCNISNFAQIAAAAGIKCDRAIDCNIASKNDYKALAKIIDTGVIV